MNAQGEFQHPEVKNGDRIGDYRVGRTADLEEINARFIELEHMPTGARHVHISRDDRENAFSAAFKTVPTDSTGVAHILEHTTLCGSRKFPVRDPFFSMIKRSLNTFMNAFTASDWTMYPFCTQNRKDYYNLMDVYLDATFYPELSELNFKQEGHRLELEDGQAGIQRRGLQRDEGRHVVPGPGHGAVSPECPLPGYDLQPQFRRRAGGHTGSDPRPAHGVPQASLPSQQRLFLHLRQPAPGGQPCGSSRKRCLTISAASTRRRTSHPSHAGMCPERPRTPTPFPQRGTGEKIPGQHRVAHGGHQVFL